MADRKSGRGRGRAGGAPPGRPPAARVGAARPGGPGLTLTTGVAAIVLAFLVLVFFHAVMIEGKAFVAPDAQQPAGFVAMGEKSLAHDHVYPLWNPFVFLGMPSFGSGAYNPLIYPPDWPLGLIQKVLPLPGMLWLVLYYFLGGLFLYLLAREWGAAPEGALLGATIFVFVPNLVAVGSHGHGSQLVDSAYVPLLLWLAARWWRRGGLANLAWLALAGGFQLLRGHVQICFYTWLAVGLHAVWEVVARLARRESTGVVLGRAAGIAVAAGLAFGLAGFYSLPLRDYARWSIRGGGADGGVGMDYATAWSMAPRELPEIVFPGWAGFGGATYWGGMPFTDYPNAFVGMVALLLLLPSLFARPEEGNAAARGPDPRPWALALALLALLVGFGSNFPLYRFLYDHLPLFNKFRIPVMILLLFHVAVALGAAWGWSAALAGRPAAGPRRPGLDRVLLVALALVGGGLVVGFLGREAWHAGYVRMAIAARGGRLRFGSDNFGAEQAEAAWQGFWASFVVAMLLGLAALVVAWLARPRTTAARSTPGGSRRLAATAAVLALVLLELWPVSNRVMAPVIGDPPPRGVAVGRDEAVDWLEKAGPPGTFRILPLDEFQSNRYATFGIASIGGYHPAKPRLFQDFVDGHFVDNFPWMRLLNVRYIVSSEPYQVVPPSLRVVRPGSPEVLEFAAALPRVTVVGEYRVVTPARAILDSVAGGRFDDARLTFLERDPGLRLGPVEGARATLDAYRLNDLRITVDTPGPALVRVADLWYPDWTATVDGAPASLLKADYLLRAVPVPAGHHVVVMRFRSAAVRQGLILSLVSLAVVLAGFAASWLGRRRGAPPAPPAAPAGAAEPA